MMAAPQQQLTLLCFLLPNTDVLCLLIHSCSRPKACPFLLGFCQFLAGGTGAGIRGVKRDGEMMREIEFHSSECCKL